MSKKLYAGVGVVIVIAAVVIGIFAVRGNHNTASQSASSMPIAAVTTSAVTIQNYMFSPMAIKVKVGTTVTWMNKDAVNHTVTADTNSTDAPSSMDIAQGKSFSFTFKKVGTYTYHCFPHPYMHGTVEVTNS